MAVRSRLPWPLRWVGYALALGFCAAIGLWAFEFGRHIAGLDSGHENELAAMREELTRLRAEKVAALAAANSGNATSTLLVAEKVAQEKLVQQIKQLETENRSLRDDLGFFEQLIPAAADQAISVRSLQAEIIGNNQLKWQVLVLQPTRKAPEFDGQLEISLSGTQAGGKPWSLTLPGSAQPIKLRQYGRFEGLVNLPEQTVVKNVSVKVMEGSATRATHSIKL